MRYEIRITGLGGQGAITAGHILGRAAALYEGKEAVVTEGYSPYVTGGWSRADIIIAEEPIDFPLVSKLDVLVTMYQEGLDINLKLVKANGLALAESKLVDSSRVRSEEKRRVVSIPAAVTAENLGKKMLTNVVLLGSLGALVPVVSLDSLKRALAERFPKASEINMKAVDLGYQLALKAISLPNGENGGMQVAPK